MSKYQALWEYVVQASVFPFSLTFEEIQLILGFPIDHSFLNAKKELDEFGFKVDKISLKNKSIIFDKK